MDHSSDMVMLSKMNSSDVEYMEVEWSGVNGSEIK